ncbi:MAG TPA: RHS repeat-associated core domain-containing protein, partial [Verrucomicrobiae bacterium]|nr:RHS repeat-associated core domain-containing protein [Verrucomicrobiae bacterium]
IQDRRPGLNLPAGDSRRNTQLFQYDDLHRLTRVQYSFHLPGETVRNDGDIGYRYDRIGNLLAQNSTLNHEENGLPVANIGEMQSGGALGRFNRTGRTPQDPPGPHALSSVQGRDVTCDANGNFSRVNGLECRWDFKDRLRAAENETMRAEYAYDYADRRISKRVAWKPGSGPDPNTPSVNTLYINRYFEVRDAEQPTKYIWDGETRIAAVVGSLTSNSRLQRIGISPGWNLVSLAVGSTSTVAQLQRTAGVDAVYRWMVQSGEYQLVTPGENLPAGTVLWIRASTAGTLYLRGTYAEPADVSVNGPGLYPVPGLQAMQTQDALPADANLAWFDEAMQRWRFHSGSPTGLVAELPASIAAGKAVFVHSSVPREVNAPDARAAIRYYHGDHLGSASVMSDGQGNVLEESAYYPFGATRHRSRAMGATGSAEPYQFTDKEKDRETELYNFEARLLVAGLSRFLRPDPKYAAAVRPPPSAQHLNLYAYSLNNPLRFTDPSGLDPVATDPNEAEYTEAADKAKERAVEMVTPAAEAEIKEIWAGLATGEKALVGVYAAAAAAGGMGFGAISLSLIPEIPISSEFHLKLDGNLGDEPGKGLFTPTDPETTAASVSVEFGYKPVGPDGEPIFGPSISGTILYKVTPPEALPNFPDYPLPAGEPKKLPTQFSVGVSITVTY